MKTMILAISMVLGFTANVHAAGWAKATYPGSVSVETAMIDLFAKEMQKDNSPLKQYVEKIKQDNPDYFIGDSIDAGDILRLESGASGGQYGSLYLIVIRAGYKSNTFPMGYLKMHTWSSEDDEAPFTVSIEGSANIQY